MECGGACVVEFASCPPTAAHLLHAGKGPSDGLGATYKSNMTAAEMRGVYMIDTFAAYKWLFRKFVTPTRKKAKHQKERHSIGSHQFYYVPAHGEVLDTAEAAADIQHNIVGHLNRKRTKEMTGGTGKINNFDFFAPEGVLHIGVRWLSHSCPPCLAGLYGNCQLGKSKHEAIRIFIAEKNYTGASEAKALMRDRIEALREKVVAGMFVAVYQISDTGRRFTVVRSVAEPRRAVIGELVSGLRAKSTQQWVLEVHFGELLKQKKDEPAMYQFSTGECCTETYDNCGEAKGCRLVHSHKVFLDVILPPIKLPMEQHGIRKQSRRQSKRQKVQPTAQASSQAPEHWILPPGSEQRIMATLSDDQQTGVSYTMRV